MPSSAALFSSTVKAFASTSTSASLSASSTSKPQFLKFYTVLRLRLRLPCSSSISLSRRSHSAKTFAVKASTELPVVGNAAPDFEAEAVLDQEFIKVKLSDYIGKKYVILLFYSLDFTFVCPTEITAFSDRHAEFEALNTQVLGVSVDSVFSHLAWVQTDRKSGGLGDLKYPLVSDVTKSISKSYGVLIPDQGIAVRKLFIIDKEGVIQHSTINNLAIGRSVDETKRTLQAMQSVQDKPDEETDFLCTSNPKPFFSRPKSQFEFSSSSHHDPSLSSSFHSPKTPHFPIDGGSFLTGPTSPILSTKTQTQTQTQYKTKTKIKTKTKTKIKPPSPQILKSFKPQIPSPPSDFHEKALYLDSIGLDLCSLVHDHPPIVSASLPDLKSTVHFLTSLGFTTHEFRRLVGMCPEFLASRVSDIIPIFTFLLREACVNGSDLKRVINRRPRLLASSVKHRLRPTLYFLQSIGIAEVNKHTSLLSCSVEDKLQPRIDYLEKIGFSRRDALMMFRRFPQLFCYSIEQNLEPKFNYFVVEMRRELKELKEFPHYFSFSLENRIRPRHQWCVEKGVCFPLPILLKTSEAKFRDRLEVCCNSSIPLRNSPLWCTNSIHSDFDK